mmetsp:Transcript_21783/g.86485  ORF Transcript_21783/g.86485 Transcript_21783/m.86485 type:complete len:398 (-) Transcript_21783:222-1415(-)|eukprot:CAMPEP_0185717860 /NCGR_PEP_ID=MMETSP1164-20130828/45649_1 /TAXON_ID=1104430 /ORGANISM="Chrysoreinhardia sp, Strain CCMP2950" /LENGTH=397 /DNA_ID=CAMNT_0028385505 /DNA_START=245 /DNA_END=1438 /DNA_ORIENTATION=-
MTSFDKSSVDAAELSDKELHRVFAALFPEAHYPPQRTWKLSNGACAANYAVVRADGSRCVVKAVTGDESASLASTQVRVLRALRGACVAPDAVSDEVVACVTSKDAPASAVAMEFVVGAPANLLVRDGRVSPVVAYAALGAALARLHRFFSPGADTVTPRRDAVDLLAEVAAANDVAHPRYLETYIRVPADRTLDDLGTSLEDNPHPFVTGWLLADGRLAEARRSLADRKLARGLLHGDPYADNLMLELSDDGGDVARARLIDWEDACVGPIAYDLGCAAVACAFRYDASTDVAELLPDVFAAILAAYAEVAGPELFTSRDADALADLMRANALAVATYRWHTFCLLGDPDAPAAARDSYKEMVAIAAAIDARVTDLARQAVQLKRGGATRAAEASS